MTKNVVVVIPAYNEEQTIVSVIHGLRARGFTQLIVVDDGSSDRTAELAHKEGTLVARHLLNRGVGGAWRTGIKAALSLSPQIIVTFDADGQHHPNDIAALIEPIAKREAEIVIGSRQNDTQKIPTSRRWAHWIANWVTYFLFGVRTSDSQSGMRAFSYAAAAQLQIMSSGMEICSEIFAEAARKRLTIREVPIRAIYTEYSLSKGQSFKVGLRTLSKLVMARVRRTAL